MEVHVNGKQEVGLHPVEGEAQGLTRPDPEVSAKPVRRKYSPDYKRRILNEVERCTKKGAVGALLRREGLYSSLLSLWRKEREARELKALSPKKRGRKPKAVNPLSQSFQELERENRRLEKKLKQAELVIEVQKKISELLEIPLSTPPFGGKRG